MNVSGLLVGNGIADVGSEELVEYVTVAWYDDGGSTTVGKAVEPPVGAELGAVGKVGNDGASVAYDLLRGKGTARAAEANVMTARAYMFEIVLLG